MTECYKQHEKNNSPCTKTPIRLTTNFSSGNNGDQNVVGWHKVWKIKNYQLRILYPAKLSFKNKVKIKTFPGKKKLRIFVANRSSLPEKTKENSSR